MEEININYVFNEMPMYSKEVFNILKPNVEQTVYKIDRDEINRMVNYINSSRKKIITNCIWCNKEFSFNYNKILYELEYEDYIEEKNDIRIAFKDGDGLYINLDEGNIWGIVGRQIEVKDLIDKNYYLIYLISCNNDLKHIYSLNLLISIEKDKIVITKVGQYPSILSVKGFDFNKYKKQLNKYDAYEDYKNATLSMSNGFHAGAYTYLRRVYEKQLNFYIEKNKIELSDNKTETKIKAVKENFDPRIHEHLKNLYGILSTGIHELDEEESKEYYEYLKAMIDMQLQFEKNKDEEEAQSKTINTKISNIVTKLKQRK